jgi:NADPH-dependent ferric siderophore reductase
MNAIPPVSHRTKPGLVERAVIRLFMRDAQVSAVEQIASDFRLIEFSGENLRGMEWIEGQKLQIAPGSAFVTRTYTPILFDSDKGQTKILAYSHGVGPGSDWASSVAIGESCHLFGPRQSLQISSGVGPLILFGDETSIGLSYAVATRWPDREIHHLFEVSTSDAAATVISHLNLTGAEIYARKAGDAHLQAIASQIGIYAERGAEFVLTGKATSVQSLRQAMKLLNITSTRIKTKAYWSLGKTGLD